MSATGRTPNLRAENDQYPTPPWAVERFMEAVRPPLRGGRWLEPCAGAGTIIQAANRVLTARGEAVNWHAVEIDPKYEGQLCALANPVVIGDFLHVVPARYDVVLTNPPFELAEEFVRACLPIASHVAMLLRVGWVERRDLLDEHPADVWVLPDRPSFGRNRHGKIGTDAAMYGWFHWYPGCDGRIRRLGRTPSVVRAEWRRYLDRVLPRKGEADGRAEDRAADVRGAADRRGGEEQDSASAAPGHLAAGGDARADEAARDEAPHSPWPSGPEDFGGEDFPSE